MTAARTAHAVATRLAEQLARDPANTVWQGNLSVSHDRIGNVLLAQGDGPGALAAYRKGLTIRETLAAHDPTNTHWQGNLAVSHKKIGDVLVAQGEEPRALVAYRRGLAIAEALAAHDPTNTQWLVDVAFSCAKLGSLGREHPTDLRRAYLMRGREILIALKTKGRLLPRLDWITWFDARMVQLSEEDRQGQIGVNIRTQ
jgi:hypothetical protein